MAVVSGKLRNKKDNGDYDELRPFNTIDEVFFDIDKDIKLKEVLNQLIDYKSVDSIENMYQLTSDDVTEGTIIKVSNGDTYKVVDINNLSNANGYEKVTNLGAASSSITLTTYNASDLTTT